PATEKHGALYASAAWTSSGASPGRLLMGADGTWSLGGAHGTVSAYVGQVVMNALNGAVVYAGSNAYMQAAGSAASMEVGPAGTHYSWLVKAERIGGDFPAERPKVQWSGPDTSV